MQAHTILIVVVVVVVVVVVIVVVVIVVAVLFLVVVVVVVVLVVDVGTYDPRRFARLAALHLASCNLNPPQICARACSL